LNLGSRATATRMSASKRGNMLSSRGIFNEKSLKKLKTLERDNLRQCKRKRLSSRSRIFLRWEAVRKRLNKLIISTFQLHRAFRLKRKKMKKGRSSIN
jgi:hypothetical protein